MISFLETFICGTRSNLQPIWSIVGFLINAIMIGVPILLIIFGMIDLGKAVIASKEEEVKKATKLLGKRFLYAVGVFAVVWFVVFVLDAVKGVTDDNYTYDANSWQYCWRCNIRGKQDATKCREAAERFNIPESER